MAGTKRNFVEARGYIEHFPYVSLTALPLLFVRYIHRLNKEVNLAVTLFEPNAFDPWARRPNDLEDP